MNNKIFKRLLAFLICIFFHTVQSQILSVSPGTSFNIVSGTLISADGLELTPSSDFVLNAGVEKSSTTSNSTAFPYIPRVYLFSQTTNPFSGIFKINYTNSDLIGINLAENDLKVIYHGNGWSFDSSSTNNANANYTASGTFNSITLDEITLATCLPSTNSFVMKLSNESTHVKYLLTTINTWSIISGVDATDFSIIPFGNSQELLFNNVAINSNPHDSNLDNNYLVNVTNGCEVQNLTINISPFCGNWADIVTP